MARNGKRLGFLPGWRRGTCTCPACGTSMRTFACLRCGFDYRTMGQVNIQPAPRMLWPSVPAPRRSAEDREHALGADDRSQPTTAEIRRWAREQGYDVNDKGRVPSAVLRAYRSTAV